MNSSDGAQARNSALVEWMRKFALIEWMSIAAFVIGIAAGVMLGCSIALPGRTDVLLDLADELSVVASSMEGIADELPDRAGDLQVQVEEVSRVAQSLEVAAEGSVGAAEGKVPSLQEVLQGSPAVLWALAILGSAWAAPRAAAKIQTRVARRRKEENVQGSDRLAGARAWNDVESLAALTSSGFVLTLVLSMSVRCGIPVLAALIAAALVFLALVAQILLRRHYSKMGA